MSSILNSTQERPSGEPLRNSRFWPALFSYSSVPPQSRLAQRLICLCLVLGVEWIPLTAIVHPWREGAPLARFLAVYFALFLLFAYFRRGDLLRRAMSWNKPLRLGRGWLAGHVFSLLLFVGISYMLASHHLPADAARALTAAWYCTGAAAILLEILAFVPPALTLQLLRCTGKLWAYALAAAIAVSVCGEIFYGFWTSRSWNPLTDLTFSFVKLLLGAVLSPVISDRSKFLIGTPVFHVSVGRLCSGMQGLAMMLVFSVAWLCFSRRRLRFPQALLLIPAGLLVIYVANALRITALILIGVAGAPRVAIGGFHSQAGWIAFSAVTLGFAAVCERWTWLKVPAAAESGNGLAVGHDATAGVLSRSNPTLIYLMPFLVIMAASLLTHAASAGFEWLYPLRFFAAVIAIWLFRAHYRRLNWRVGWAAPAIGALVFIIWIALDRLVASTAGTSMPTELAGSGISSRTTWIAFRVLAAVTTVPIAEELAFRGFLLRRIVDADFESVSFQRVSWVALLVSSLAFGLLHGNRWIAGTVAGLLYAWVLVRKGNIGDSVTAHAVTNALLAAYVLWFDRWNLW